MHIRRMLCGKQNHHRRPIKMLFEILWKTLKSIPECCLNAWEHTRSRGWDVTYRKHNFLVAGHPMEDLPNTPKSVSSASKYVKESNPHARCTSTLFSCTLGTPLRNVLGMNLTYFPRPGILLGVVAHIWFFKDIPSILYTFAYQDRCDFASWDVHFADFVTFNSKLDF